MQPIQIAVGSDTSTADISSLARLLNGYAETIVNSSGPYPVAVVAAPGSRKLFNVPGGIQILGMHKSPNKIFFCTRRGLYSITRETYSLIALRDFAGYVSMDTNGIDLVVVDGTGFGLAYTLATGASRIIDFPVSFSSIKFIDGFFICEKKSSGRIYASDIYSTNFSALQFATAEALPDNIVTIERLQRQLYIFGQQGMEVWYNSGDIFPLSPNQSAFIEVGCIGRRASTATNKAAYWIGNDLVIYMAPGYTPERISTHGIEKILASFDCTKASLSEYAYNGHHFVFVQVPGLDYTMVYDESTGLWHDRSYSNSRHFADFMETLNGITYIGSSLGSDIHVFDQSSGVDSGVRIKREMITPPAVTLGRVSAVELTAQFFNMPDIAKLWQDQTMPERSLIPQFPSVSLAYTDDDGQTWSEADEMEMEQNSGLIIEWRNCGYCLSGRRSYKFTTNSVMPFVWAGVQVG